MNPIKIITKMFLLAAASGAFSVTAAHDIDNTNTWAWSSNAGWVNHKTGYGTMLVYNDHLEGFAWSESIGWLRLGSYTGGGTHTYLNTAADNYGINVSGSTGNLTGYAWSSNAGWINFSTAYGSVTINPATGDVSGHAWSESIGWVKFSGTALDAIPYKTNITLSGPLPVELTSFTASTVDQRVTLHWNTATEMNNYGFDIERKSASQWSKIGFIEGHGTTNTPRSYSFTDGAASGKISYRLKQIDRDGTNEYSKEIELTIAATPTIFALSQNFPNPFNPTTNIAFTVSSNARATLKILNTLGQEVATLFNGEAQSGIVNQVQFNGAEHASGIYFSRLEQNGKVQMSKMTLIK